MSYISYKEYKEITKGFKSRHRKNHNKNLIAGCYYYIDDVPERTRKSETNYRTVMYGKYIEEVKEKYNTYYSFSNLRFIVNPFKNVAMPLGFGKTGHVFILDENTPCDHNILNKKKNIEELESTIDEMKVQPVEEGESNISFIGKDYRRAMSRLNKTHKSSKSHKTHESHKTRSHTTPKSPKSPKYLKSESLGGKRKTQKRKKSKIHK